MAEVEQVWDRIRRHAGAEFRTVQGLPFTCEVPGNDVVVTRNGEQINRSFSKTNFRKAAEQMPVDGPASLRARQGSSCTGSDFSFEQAKIVVQELDGFFTLESAGELAYDSTSSVYWSTGLEYSIEQSVASDAILEDLDVESRHAQDEFNADCREQEGLVEVSKQPPAVGPEDSAASVMARPDAYGGAPLVHSTMRTWDLWDCT